MSRIAHLLQPESPPTIELLPCPFCGGPARVYRIDDGWMAECADDQIDGGCQVYSTAGPYATAAEVAQIWNHRGGHKL